MEQGKAKIEFPKRINQLQYAFGIKIWNEVLRIVNGDESVITNEIIEKAYTNIMQEIARSEDGNAVGRVQYLERALDEQQKEASDREREQKELNQRLTINITELNKEVDKQRYFASLTQASLERIAGENGVLKKEIIILDKRRRATMLELLHTRTVLKITQQLLYQANSKPYKTRLQKLISTFINLTGGGVAFTVSLPLFIASLVSGNYLAAFISGAFVIGGFLAVAMVELNFLGWFETSAPIISNESSLSVENILSDGQQLSRLSDEANQAKNEQTIDAIIEANNSAKEA